MMNFSSLTLDIIEGFAHSSDIMIHILLYDYDMLYSIHAHCISMCLCITRLPA